MNAPPTDRPAPPPLSVAQEALWLQSVLFPQEVVYNEVVSIRHDGPLDVAALRRALGEVIRRHEIWRTTFDVVDGTPVQIVHPARPVDLPVLDLSHLAPDQADERATQVIGEVARVYYDVRRGPLLRPRLLLFGGEHQRLYLALHHIIFDGVSLYRTVVPELVALYTAFAAGQAAPLDEPVMQYGEFARWEQEWIEGPRAQRRLAWWREHLSDAPEVVLPVDHPRRRNPRFHGGVDAWDISRQNADRLREIAGAQGSTSFQAFGAIWALLLSRWSGQEDVVFGTAADLRQRPELVSMVGYCLTPLVVRVSLADDPSFLELIGRVRNAVLDGLDHLIPFERIVRELHPGSDRAVNPVYQTMLVLEPPAAPADPSWTLHQMEAGLGDAVGTMRLDLELELDERPDGHLAGRVLFDRELFDRETIGRLTGQLSRIVAAVCADPELPISRIPLVSEAEVERQTIVWAATATAWDDAPASVAELIARRARENPDAPAVIAGDRTFSRSELQARDDTEAAQLRGQTADAGAATFALALAAELGLGEGDVVVVLPELLRRAPQLALWPALGAGAVVVLASAEDAATGAALSRLARIQKATLLYAEPDGWQTLVDTGLRGSRALRALSGPGRLERTLADEILTRCRVLFHGHGLDGSLSTLGQVRGDGAVSIGRPLAGRRAYVVDRHDRPMPVALAGELMLAGDGVSPDAASVQDPFGEGPALRTGQRARWLADGRLDLL